MTDPSRPTKNRRPRPPAPARDLIDRAAMIRVDHAGEHGAVRIYEGQLAVFSALPHKARIASSLRRMRADEQAHLDAFDALVRADEAAPTLIMPLWTVMGRSLGAATALMGEKAAHACTAAVETVIDQHYQEQIDRLPTEDASLRPMIEKFQAEEVAHKNEAIAEGAAAAPFYPLLSGVIEAGCRLAIAISKRI